MHKVKKVKTEDIMPVMKEILGQGGKVRIPVSGRSMLPFLHQDKDSVELSAANFSVIKRGDIVLIVRETGVYVLHRVLRKYDGCFYINGDSQQWTEGPLQPEQLIAVATAVWRNGKHIECSSLFWRASGTIWLYIKPFRNFIFHLYGLIKRTLSRISSLLFSKTSNH